ncbi:MAG: DUF4423 domain-containing protein [Sandaracinaceae bacterium]
MTVDCEVLVRQIVRARRAHRSQTALSRRLGFRSNVVYTWESGRRQPSASELFRVVARTGGEPESAFRDFAVDVSELDLADPTGVALVIAQLRGAARVRDVAIQCGVSRYVASRWLRGETEPRASEFFKLVDALTFRLVDLAAALASPDALPEIAQAWRELSTRREIAFTHPWSQAILRQLETRLYRELPAHQPGWLAARLNIGEDQEHACLDALSRGGLIRWQDKHWVTEPVAVDTSMASDLQRRALKLHWIDAGRDRLDAGREGLFSWAVVALSREDYERLRSAHVRYMRSLRQLVDASGPSEVVAVVNMQLFPLE